MLDKIPDQLIRFDLIRWCLDLKKEKPTVEEMRPFTKLDGAPFWLRYLFTVATGPGA